jgi:HlyD family secretion protein
LVALLPTWVRPAVDREDLRIATVDVGPVEEALQASGTVVPAFEQSVVSPVEARVLSILRRPGDRVRVGEPLVELDLAAARLAVERADEQLARRRDETAAAERDLEREIGRRAAAVRQAELDLELAALRRDQQRRLHEAGLIPEPPLTEAEVEHERASLALAQAGRDLAAARDDHRTAVASSRREIALLAKERGESLRILRLGTTRADRAGVVTWVVPREGRMVARGEELARVADLSRFGVLGRIASVHAGRLAAGQPVRVELDRATRLGGTVTAVDPTIEEGTALFRVRLDHAAHRALRNALRVEVWVIAARREAATRVPKGPFATVDGGRSVLVVAGDRLLRRRVELGLSGIDHHEVVEGLEPGERVVLSDLSQYRHLQEIRLR